MPDSPSQPNQPQKDSNGYVHIELDAPAGSIVTQPLAGRQQPSASPPETGKQTSAASQSPVPAPQQRPGQTFSSSASSPRASPSDLPPEAQQVAQQLAQVKSTHQAAKQVTEDALKDLTLMGEKERQDQQRLQQQVEETQQKIGTAQQQLERAQQQQQRSQQKLQEIKGQGGPVTIAGYAAADLIQAPVKPPQPVNTPDNDAKPTVDEQTQQRLEQRSRQAEEAVKQTKKQLEAADKQVSRARQAAQKTQTQYAEITRKITAIVQGLAGNQQDSSEPQTYKPFTILGAVFLVLAVVILIFARTSLWVLVALAAVVQLGMGFMLRTRSQ